MNFSREIEKIREKINQVSRMIHNVTGGHMADEPSEKLSFDSFAGEDSYYVRYEKLGALILRLQDGELEKKYLMRLEKWMLADIDAVRYYVEFTNLCGMLRMFYGKGGVDADQLSDIQTVS